MNTHSIRPLSGCITLMIIASMTAHALEVVNTTPAKSQAGMSTQAGQTFTTPVLGIENKLFTVTVRGPQNGATSTVYTMKIWQDTDGNVTTWDPGTLVATSTNSIPINTNNGNHVFTFNGEVLADNTVYVVSFNDGINDHVGFRAGLTNVSGVAIANGSLFSGGTTPFSNAYDLSFIVTTIDPSKYPTWTAADNTTWDVGSTANWQDPFATPITFANGTEVTFDDTDPVGTVVLSGTIEPGSTLFDAATTSYTLSGDPIAGSGGLTVNQGSVTLLNDNTYSGTTTIVGGTLTLGNGGTSGSLGSGGVSNAGQLIVNRGDTPIISNVITGAGSLALSGSGTVTLGGASTFTGGTTITGGGTAVLGNANGIGKSGTFGGKLTVRNGTFDTNGFTNYQNQNVIGGPFTWLTTATVTVGGEAGATTEITDTAAIPKGIAFANGTALVYDATNDPGTATISAKWTQSGTTGVGTRTVTIGDSAGTDTEVDFTGGLGDATAADGRQTTVRKTGPGTMQVSSVTGFPRLQISEGTLRVNHVEALGTNRSGGLTNQVTVDSTGILDLNGFSPSIGALADNGVNTGIITNNAATTTSTLAVGSSGTSTSYKGIIEDGTGIVALNVIGGTLTLGETKTYTGDTTITGGTLRLNTTALASEVIVSSGGTVASGTDASAGTGVLDRLTADGGAASFRVSDLGSDKLVVAASNGFSVDTSTTINSIDIDPDGLTLPFTTNVIEYSGSIQGAAGFAGLAVLQHGPTFLTDTGSAIQLTVTGDPADTLIWVGNVDGNWTVNGDSNWKLDSDSSSVPFYELDKVIFNDTATGTTAVTLGTAVTPESLEFNNSTKDYTLQGAPINGSTGILKNGSGIATIIADCSYTGGTTVNGGTLAFGNGGSDGEPGFGTTTIAAGATLEINTSDFLNFKATTKLREVGGAGNIVLSGGGTLWNYPGTDIAFTGEANSWDDFSGNLTVKGGSEFQTIRNGATAMGTGNIILGDGSSSGNLSQIEGDWTWTNPISVVGADNYIRNRSLPVVSPRSLKLQGAISGAGNLTVQDTAVTMTDPNRGFVITNDVTMTGTITIATATPLRVGGVPGEVDVSGTGLDADSSGSLGTTAVVNNGTLTFSRTDSHTPASAISGTGSVRIGIPSTAGRGDTSTQVVTFADATKTYSGITSVESGTLLINGSLPNSQIDVNSEGTLGGTGSVAQATLVYGALAPGASVGTLAFSDQIVFIEDSSYRWEVSNFTGSAGAGYDTLTAADLQFEGTAANPVTIVIEPLSVTNFSETNSSFTLATSPSPISVLDSEGFVVDASAFAAATGSAGTWAVQLSGDSLSLELVYSAGSASDYDNWAGPSGFNLTGGPADDDDNDGLSNFDEYAFGLDPTSGASVLPLTAPDKTAGTFTYTRRSQSLSNLDYTYESSTSLGAWSAFTPDAPDVSDSGDPVETITVTLPSSLLAEPKLFLRVKAVEPAP